MLQAVEISDFAAAGNEPSAVRGKAGKLEQLGVALPVYVVKAVLSAQSVNIVQARPVGLGGRPRFAAGVEVRDGAPDDRDSGQV